MQIECTEVSKIKNEDFNLQEDQSVQEPNVQPEEEKTKGKYDDDILPTEIVH